MCENHITTRRNNETRFKKNENRNVQKQNKAHRNE